MPLARIDLIKGKPPDHWRPRLQGDGGDSERPGERPLPGYQRARCRQFRL
jgi:hypothetical protein